MYGSRGCGDHLLRRTQLDDAAGLHDGDAIAHQPGDRQVVGDEQHRHPDPRPQIADEGQHALGQRRVQGAGGLVAQQHRGRDHRGAGQHDALALPAGQLTGAGLGDLRRQVDRSQRRNHALPDLGP